jgi:hypothetical protein
MEHPGPCVLVGTGDAFGEAINLHDTDAALFVMLPWTPGQVRQWEGRFCRLGQKRPVVVYYVVAERWRRTRNLPRRATRSAAWKMRKRW